MPYLNVTHVVEGDRYELDTALSRAGVDNLVTEFLRAQMGKGADKRKADQRDEYVIRMSVDLSDDTYSVWDNCGNKGLRDGILMCLIRDMKDNPGSVRFV